ncbi:MAG: hypothetical protein WB588_08680 [Dehalococcoidia bacterium]
MLGKENFSINTFWIIIAKTVAVHTLTYFGVGFAAFKLFNYTATLARQDNNLRPSTDPLVKAGVLFQPIRGILFGLIFYFFRDILFHLENGWLITWAMLVFVGIFSTFTPAAGSIEGFIYIKSSNRRNWGGLVEILTQSLLLSIITYYWVVYPDNAWLNWTLGVLFAVSMILPALGLLAGKFNSRKT